MPKPIIVTDIVEGASGYFLAKWLTENPEKNYLYIAIDDVHLHQTAKHLDFFAPQLSYLSLPAWDCLPYDRIGPDAEITHKRIETLYHLTTHTPPQLILTTAHAILQRMPPPEMFKDCGFLLNKTTHLSINKLTALGYIRVETVYEQGEFAVRGGILDVFPIGANQPLRIDMFGDEIESIRTFDPLSQRTSGEMEEILILPSAEILLTPETISRFRHNYRDLFGAHATQDLLYQAISSGQAYKGYEHYLPLFFEKTYTLFDYLPHLNSIIFGRHAEETLQTRHQTIEEYYQLRLQQPQTNTTSPYRPLSPETTYITEAALNQCTSTYETIMLSYHHIGKGVATYSAHLQALPPLKKQQLFDKDFSYQEVLQLINQHIAAKKRIIIACYSEGTRDRLSHMLQLSSPLIEYAILELEHGFYDDTLFIITEQDILGDRLTRASRKHRLAENFLKEISEINSGDYVVHHQHGIGRYQALETLTINNISHDFLRIIYENDDKLFIPVENMDTLSRYGSSDMPITLDKLGGVHWQTRTAKIKQRIKELAAELIKTARDRALTPTEAIFPQEGLYDEFINRFPYQETEDQLSAIEAVSEDLASGKPMDRLICGDVGFGKTEIALRAAFLVAMSGKQVALLTPTTLLARQHYNSFLKRFSGFPLVIRQLSRFVSGKDQKLVKEEAAKGQADILIGTHALLAKNIIFNDLGLLIIDEEQHFGVKQKETLKKAHPGLHILTLTATPIPRTLQLSLSGVQEMSLITTPPIDRLAVRTFITPFDETILREAILREFHRRGQIFYVCPRIEDLEGLKETLTRIVPEIKFHHVHGQMPAKQLEETIASFIDHAFDLLLSTNIIESGLDIPNANTIIIHRADMFGLAQLYQIRGRVGRSKTRGYAYLTYQNERLLTKSAESRLNVMKTLDHLGAGFTLASHDMDIRGAGNLLGEEQSGHIREVGVELYQKMLEEAIEEHKAGLTTPLTQFTPQLNLGIPVLIPESYIQDLNLRLSMYRKSSGLKTDQEIAGFQAELIDRFGPIPLEVNNLLKTIHLKNTCLALNIEKIDTGPKGTLFTFHNNTCPNPEALLNYIMTHPQYLTLRPDQKLFLKAMGTKDYNAITHIEGFLREVMGLIKPD